jgi:DNA repair protein RecO (recombination protein O)
MAAEKAQALVLLYTDWSESSRIVTLWTREFGKVRGLAKGGRRLKSSFENALDLLTVCSIVFLRKSPGALDLLTEAQLVQRFGRLRSDLAALYAAYYVAELLADWTEEYDPHPLLYDEAVATLAELGSPAGAVSTAARLVRFEMVFLRELGYNPVLEECAGCSQRVEGEGLVFVPALGGVLCSRCRGSQHSRGQLSPATWRVLCRFAQADDSWRQGWEPDAHRDVRVVLGQYVTYLRGRRPRLLPYLENGEL